LKGRILETALERKPVRQATKQTSIALPKRGRGQARV
jgi:hypothetical protein